MIKVSIVEDDKLILEAIRDLINETDGFNCSGYYGDCESAIEDMKNNRPDVMLMDIELPGISGIEGVKKIKELYPKTDIIMLTVHEDLSLVFQALTRRANVIQDS